MEYIKEGSASNENQKLLYTSFLAGAFAGLVVDISLFPLDTLKTRLQSQHGFWKSGGFKGIYRGIGPVLLGSAPSAALFFTTYNGCKKILENENRSTINDAIIRGVSAANSELVCCIVRVPTDVVKQRRQAYIKETSAINIVRTTIKQEGFIGLYRGFGATILRDTPFSIIQYPLWEFLKETLELKSPEGGALCGALAGKIKEHKDLPYRIYPGAVSGALTTPLDVIRTRTMLHQKKERTEKLTLNMIIKSIHNDSGFKGFFAGLIPRTAWIFFGGGIFFGSYELAFKYLNEH